MAVMKVSLIQAMPKMETTAIMPAMKTLELRDVVGLHFRGEEDEGAEGQHDDLDHGGHGQRLPVDQRQQPELEES